jgi:hypothetical protein
VCLAWLVGGGPDQTYGVTVGLFVVQVFAVFIAAFRATRMVLWK